MRTEAVVNSQGKTGYLTNGKVIFKLKLLIYIYLMFIFQNIHQENDFLSILFYGIEFET